MLFTAPAFLFLFLPLSFLLYAVLGKGHRRECLLLICFAYHLVLNLFHLYTLLILACLILYTYLAGILIRRVRHSALTAAVCLLPYVLLIALRIPAYGEVEGFVYPIGLTITTLGTTSYFLDTLRAGSPSRHRMFDLCLYLGFFPVMLAGPFVKYSEFQELAREDRISFGVVDFADGACLFMTGLIKRIVVGAVLMETYETFILSIAQSSDALLTVLAMILVYFGVYFVITGYADMGCGLSKMFGIRLRYVPTHPFQVALPTQYGRALLYSFYEWLDDYVINPVICVTKGRGSYLIRAVGYGGLVLLFIRSNWYVLLMVIPCVAASYLSLRLDWEDRLRGRNGLQILTGFLTVTLSALGWVCVTVGGVGAVLRHLSQMSYSNSEYYLDKLLTSISVEECLFVLLVAAGVCAAPFLLRRGGLQRNRKKRLIVEAVGGLLLLLIFAFALLFFLPQYGIYDTVPFRYVFI